MLDYKNPRISPEQRAEDLLKRMTLEEKLAMVSGIYGSETKPNKRLGIPAMKMTDGHLGSFTSFPCGPSMAASWDAELVKETSKAIAREIKGRGRDILLGPCINIHRTPLGGRNFESFGEDPYLASRITVAYVEGIHSEGVTATVKHFACNNQEHDRRLVDTTVDERALNEIYFPAFKAAVHEAGVWAVMSAYNKLNGHYCCENSYLLDDILKKKWGFKGFVMSDWGAVHSTVETANSGLDIEMPSDKFLGKELTEAVKGGKVKKARIDDKVRRILFTMISCGHFDKKQEKYTVDLAESSRASLKMAQESIVLLKNAGNILPLDLNKIKSIAVIGPNAGICRTGGGGSSKAHPARTVSPLEGLRDRTKGKVKIDYAEGIRYLWDLDLPAIEPKYFIPPPGVKEEHGLLGEYYNNMEFKGKPVLRRTDQQINFDWGLGSPAPEINNDYFSVRWTGKLVPDKSGLYIISIASDDGTRIYMDGKLIIDNWGIRSAIPKETQIELEAGRQYDFMVEYFDNTAEAVCRLKWLFVQEKDTIHSARGIIQNKNSFKNYVFEKAVDAAAKSDVAVVFAGLSSYYESEGWDRARLELPEEQAKLILAVSNVNRNTIVVLNNGSPVLLNGLLDKVPALVEAWYSGQEGGNAIADVLLGNINPSGKLPMTYPWRWEDSPACCAFLGEYAAVEYNEGIYVGYRHFDKRNIEPLFPFGYGLSYTAFSCSNLKITPEKIKTEEKVTVTIDVQNTGKQTGAEIVQLYINDPHSSIERPLKELKGFKKIKLNPGEKKGISFVLDKSAIAFYDTKKGDWAVESGTFNVLIGNSSRDILLEGKFEVE